MTGHSRWVKKQVKRANRGHPMEGAYNVWSLLLSEVPANATDRQAREYLHAIAVQMNWNKGGKAKALKNKERHLRSSKFKARTRRKAMTFWRQGSPSCGAGRFKGFNQTWTQISGHRALLGLLRALTDPEVSNAEARRRVESYARNSATPFKPAARFSECLHLSRPKIFPVVNTECLEACTRLVWAEPRPNLERQGYLRMRKRLKQIMRALGLKNTIALDYFNRELETRLRRLSETGRRDQVEAVISIAEPKRRKTT